MKLAIFVVFMMAAFALATPVAEPEKAAEPQDLESSQSTDDLKTDSTFGFGFIKPYWGGGYYRPYYRTYYGGGYPHWGGYSSYGYGGYGYGWRPNYYYDNYW